MTVLVIGGRSRIGAALLGELADRGEKVRALTRAAEHAPVSPGVETVPGDLADPASLVAAMSGVGAVFLLSTPSRDDVAWHRNAVDAARRVGVRQLVRSSLTGADPASECTFRRHHGEADVDRPERRFPRQRGRGATVHGGRPRRRRSRGPGADRART
jgi:uncharacterized protein YbjT (DUF2867 family)